MSLTVIYCVFFITAVSNAEWIEIIQTPNTGIPILPGLTPESKNIHISQGNITTANELPMYDNQYKNLTNLTNRNKKQKKIVGSKMDKELFGVGFLPFLQLIQNTLVENAKSNFKSKLNVINHLKNSLLFNIDRKMQDLWKDDSSPNAREYKSEMEFPSNESALMTIGFLTLAVFLVKLVLQVIHAIKVKKMYLNNSGLVNYNSLSAFGRKKRSLLSSPPSIATTYEILHLIEDYGFSTES